MMNLNSVRKTWAALYDLTGIGPIHDEASYSRMVALADALIESGLAGKGRELSGLFGLVSSLIANYDNEHHPAPSVTPREMLRFLMDQHELTQKDLPEVGSQGVVSEILSGNRKLNARQIAALVTRFQVSADLFIEMPAQVQREPVQVTRRNRVVGVMVSAQDYHAMRAFYADRLRHTLKQSAEEAAAKGLTDETLEQLLTDED